MTLQSHFTIFGSWKTYEEVIILAVFQQIGPFSQNFAQKPKKFYKTKKFSGEKLPLKTPLPRSKTQNLTKSQFFLGHPVEVDSGLKRPLGNCAKIICKMVHLHLHKSLRPVSCQNSIQAIKNSVDRLLRVSKSHTYQLQTLINKKT